MSELPPLMRDQRQVDADQLRLLAIFHFIVAGLAVLGLGFLSLHYAFMHTMMTPEFWKGVKNAGSAPPPPQEFFAMFRWFYAVMGAWTVVGGIANLISGLCLQKRKHRVFSLVVSGLNILHIPFGTVLGVFTIVVLMRPSVREIYDA